MKTAQLTILFFLMISISGLHGQPPFLDSTYTWTEALYSGWTGSVYTMKYKVDPNPVLADGHNYFRILSNENESGGDWQYTYNLTRYADNQLLVRSGSTEYPVMNFNLDTNDVFDNGVFVPLTVVSRDSIMLATGETRLRLGLQCEYMGWPTVYWIEGIGSTTGLTENLTCVFDIGRQMLCVHRNDTLVYQNPEESECWLEIVSSSEPGNGNISFYPNPVYDVLTADDPGNQMESITIYNQIGEVIYSGNEKQIAVSGFPPGYFIVAGKLKNGGYVYHRMIKL